MIRRGSGRTPPYILVGLVLVIVVLGFNYWTLSSQNADLQQELEKLQSEVKISAMKQEQSEKKNEALQETVHEMDELSNRLNKKIQADDESLRKSDQDVQKLKYEITSLKNKATKMQEQINTLHQEAEDREIELSKAKETNSHLASERDDAIDAIAEKDAMINTLKRQLEQAQDEAAAARREKMAVAKPKISPGVMNIPEIEQKEPFLGPGQLDYISRGAVRTRDIGLQGMSFHRELPILPRVPPNAVRKKPRFSVADMAKDIAGPQNNAGGIGVEGAGVLAAPQPVEQINPPVNNNGGNQLMAPAAPPVMERPGPPGAVNNKPIQAPEHPIDGQGPQNDVLAPPPQHLQDNLDAAIDEEEKIVEDMMDDQDEEGNEIKQNEEANEGDNIHEEKRDILKGANILGALEVPQAIHGEGFNHQDMNVEDDPGNPANYYDANFENKIRNLGRPPDLH